MSDFTGITSAELQSHDDKRSDELRDEPTVITYERYKGQIKFHLSNTSNHELRTFITGLWAKLDPDDQKDQLLEMLEYTKMLQNPGIFPDIYLPDIAACIAGKPELGKSKRKKT